VGNVAPIREARAAFLYPLWSWQQDANPEQADIDFPTRAMTLIRCKTRVLGSSCL